jgi:hypothetical protein
LEPNTQYEYQLVLFTKETTTTNENNETVTVPAVKTVVGDADNNGSADEPAVFTTGNNLQTPNASFNETSYEEVGTLSKKKLYYFSLDKNNLWWDSGNKSAATYVGSLTYPDKREEDNALCLHTQEAAGFLAAGNLFSGQMITARVQIPPSGVVNFGRPFAARPTALRLWVKYNGAGEGATTHLTNGMRARLKSLWVAGRKRIMEKIKMAIS